VHTTQLQFALARAVHKLDFNYSPRCASRGGMEGFHPITFPKVFQDKKYEYRVVKGTQDFGTRHGQKVQSDGSQTINSLTYDRGDAIDSTGTPIAVYAVDSDVGNQYGVADYN
ncbi:immunomodulatory protein FIP-Fve, partial [Artomyces pyxidatus]